VVKTAIKKPNGTKKAANGRIPGLLTEKQAEFARQIVAGKTQGEAYTLAYLPPDGSKPETVAHLASRVARRPAVAAEIARIRSKIDRRVLVPINERLKLLAEIFTDPVTKSTDRTQAILAYSKISGDQAPDRQELSGPGGGPIPVLTASVGPLVARLSARERVEQMKRARAERANPSVKAIEIVEDPVENPS
jgi:hypothetical protein